MDVDGAGNIYVLEKNLGRVRKIDVNTGNISTVAGLGVRGFGGDGGPATNARFNLPEGLAVTTAGDLYIVDTGNRRLRFVDSSTGIIDTAAGGGSIPTSGPANLVSFTFPHAAALDGQGRVVLSEQARVRRYDPVAATVTLIAGSGTLGFGGDGRVTGTVGVRDLCRTPSPER